MVEFAPINFWGIAAAVLAGWVVAWLWYSPLLFIRPWAEMSGVDGAKFRAGLPRAHRQPRHDPARTAPPLPRADSGRPVAVG